MIKKLITGLTIVALLLTSILSALPARAVSITDYAVIEGVRYSPGDEVISKRGRASQTYYLGGSTYQTVFAGSPEFTKSATDGSWIEYSFNDYGSYYKVQHPWSSVRFYDYYTVVYDETFSKVKVYDDRWTVEYLNKQGKWTDTSFWDVIRSYKVVSDGIKLYRTGTTVIGQRVEEYFFRNGSPCKITISQTCNEAQNIRFIWKPSGIVATSDKLLKEDPTTLESRTTGVNFYNGDTFVQAIRWYDALDITDNISVVTEASAQGRKATVTFGGFAINAGGIAHLDPETFYPDAHVETSSVDGVVMRTGTNLTWADIHDGAGTYAYDDGALDFAYLAAGTTSARWNQLYRLILLFNTAGLPDVCTITDAVLSLYGYSKADNLGVSPEINIYASNPNSNVALIAADYQTLGAVAFATAITYSSFSIVGYNDFTLNATGKAAISKTGVSKFGAREVTYDAANSAPNWTSSVASYFRVYLADQGDGYKPKLVVTYTASPAPPTNVVATDNLSTKVTITWTKSDGATKYQLFRDGGACGAELGDVDTTDDNTAGAPSITAGNAVASDGTYPDKIVLSLAGTGTNNGTTYAYTVKAGNAAGWSAASSADNGHRAPGALGYQWQKSDGDSDASYNPIGGATSATYDDNAAPAGTVTPGTASASDGAIQAHVELNLAGEGINDGAGRYYKCDLTAAGCANQTSGSNRGFRRPINLTYQWYRSDADADAGYVLLGGATTDPHSDATAPADGSGRWYYCEVNATGAAAQDSTHDRGYRGTIPTVTTIACSGFDKLWAIVNAHINLEGSSTVTQIGFEYGMTTAYGDNWTDTGSWTTGDDFWRKLTPLTPATVYHYRAMAYNAEGWGYGGDRVFSTQGSATLYENLNTGGTGDSGTIYSANWTAEQFTSDNTSHRVTSVRIPLKRIGTAPGVVTLSITHADSDNFSTGADLTFASLNGNAMTTGYVWYDFDVPDITLDGASKYAIVVTVLSGNATDYIMWQSVALGALDNAVGSHSSDSGITWVSDSPADYLFEIWGEAVMSVEDAQVFSGYLETGDWLITLTYKNFYTPYYPNENVMSYFYLQLIDDTTVKAQVNCPMWGYRPGSIYIGKALADTLDWGSTDYKVRLIGSFAGTPYTDFALTFLDWTGAELSFLDKWVLSQANAIAEYDGTTLTAFVADLGEVLNATGHTIFSLGIPSINEIRPNLFEMAVLQPGREETDWTNAMQGGTDWEVKVGTTVAGTLTNWGSIINVDGQTTGGILIFLLFIGTLAILALSGQLVFGLIIGYAVLLGGAWFGLIGWVLVGLVTFLALVIFVWKVVLPQ